MHQYCLFGALPFFSGINYIYQKDRANIFISNQLGTSHDTVEFACDHFIDVWQNHLIFLTLLNY